MGLTVHHVALLPVGPTESSLMHSKTLGSSGRCDRTLKPGGLSVVCSFYVFSSHRVFSVVSRLGNSWYGVGFGRLGL